MMTDNSLNRVEKRKLEFRNKITRAAIKLFEENGIANTSVAAIIKEADIAHKTFFNHFLTKDHLLHHIASSFGRQAHDDFMQAFAKRSEPSKRLEYCLMTVARTLQPVNPKYKELLNFYLISGAGASDIQLEQREQFTAVIRQVMLDAQKQSLLKSKAGVEVCTEMVVGICMYVLLGWSLQQDFPIVDKMQEALDFLNESIFKVE